MGLQDKFESRLRRVQSNLVSRFERSSSILLFQFLLKNKISLVGCDSGWRRGQFQAFTDELSIRKMRGGADVRVVDELGNLMVKQACNKFQR